MNEEIIKLSNPEAESHTGFYIAKIEIKKNDKKIFEKNTSFKWLLYFLWVQCLTNIKNT